MPYLVMEDGHKARVLGQFRHLNLPAIYVLQIEDEYEFMQPELIEILEEIKFSLKFGITHKSKNDHDKLPLNKIYILENDPYF